MKSVVSPLVLALALSAGVAIAAEDIYRSTMPDGSIRYGEAPDPNAKSFKKVAPPPAATGVTVVTPEEKGRTFAPSQGGISVLPAPVSKPPAPPAQGQLQGGDGLPKRPSY